MSFYHNETALILNDVSTKNIEDDEDDNYAEINVVATDDYYCITNLNHYYEQQQQHHYHPYQQVTTMNDSSSPFKHSYHHHRQCAHIANKKPFYKSSSTSSSWSDFNNTNNGHNLNGNNNIKYQSANRITSTFNTLKCHSYYHQQNQQHQQKHESILEKPSMAINSFKGISLASSSTSSTNILRNKHKRCRRRECNKHHHEQILFCFSRLGTNICKLLGNLCKGILCGPFTPIQSAATFLCFHHDFAS